MDKIFIRIVFTADTPYGDFTDSIEIPEEEYLTISQKEINVLKQARVDTHIYIIEHPPLEEKEYTKEEIEIILDDIENKQLELASLKTEFETKLVEVQSLIEEPKELVIEKRVDIKVEL